MACKHVNECLNKCLVDTFDTKMLLKEVVYETSLEEYVREVGLAESCSSIKRVQGDDISLMTELVMFNKRINLFPADAQSQAVLKKLSTMEGQP